MQRGWLVFTDLCDSLRMDFAAMCGRMKNLIPLLVFVTAPLLAEPVTLKQPALLRQDRNAMSLKAGTVVELISREGNEITIKYRDLTGKIPASKLEEPKPSSTTASAPAPKASEEKKSEKKAPAAKSAPSLAENPQTTYGKLVKKAKDTVAEHDKKLVKPTDEVAKEAAR